MGTTGRAPGRWHTRQGRRSFSLSPRPATLWMVVVVGPASWWGPVRSVSGGIGRTTVRGGRGGANQLDQAAAEIDRQRRCILDGVGDSRVNPCEGKRVARGDGIGVVGTVVPDEDVVAVA